MSYTWNNRLKWAFLIAGALCTLLTAAEPRAFGLGFAAAGMFIAFAMIHVQSLKHDPPTDYREPQRAFPVGPPPEQPRGAGPPELQD